MMSLNNIDNLYLKYKYTNSIALAEWLILYNPHLVSRCTYT